ncbi:hypothetical protein WDZ92_43075 [Nostoc sp. NIES-2111]
MLGAIPALHHMLVDHLGVAAIIGRLMTGVVMTRFKKWMKNWSDR